jgi:hypothetical protein
VDATTLKLAKRLQELERQKQSITREIQSLTTALAVAGIRLSSSPLVGGHELRYSTQKPFSSMTLPESCETILKDFRSDWLSKAQIEYFVMRGGYPFSTQNSKNSVGVTLQRMVESGKCDVERTRGPQGNRYRWINTEERNTDAASTSDNRK